jgi:hypothetical protein
MKKHFIRDRIVPAFLLLFIIIGIYCLLPVKFQQQGKPLADTLWALFIALPLSVYYSYLAFFVYTQKLPKWKKVVFVILISFLFCFAGIMACKGYLVYGNMHWGEQKSVQIKGTIIEVKAPRRKRTTFDLYELKIARDSSTEIVILTTEIKTFRPGDRFEENMVMGALGYLYAR